MANAGRSRFLCVLLGSLPGLVSAADASAPRGAETSRTVSVLGLAFRGDRTPFAFTTGVDTGALWCNGTVNVAEARLRLPQAAELIDLRIWGADNHPTHDMRVSLIQSCLPNLVPVSGPTNTELAALQVAGTPGNFAETLALPPGFIVDNRDCTYWARVQFAPLCDGGGQLAIRKLRLRFQ